MESMGTAVAERDVGSAYLDPGYIACQREWPPVGTYWGSKMYKVEGYYLGWQDARGLPRFVDPPVRRPGGALCQPERCRQPEPGSGPRCGCGRLRCQ